MTSRQWSPLRIVTQRIASTPSAQLHHIAPALADTLRGCSEHDFSPTRTKPSQDDRDLGVVAHKFKTQLSTLLQDKPREARWAAVVLIKAAIEHGGLEVLQSAEPWARGILGLLNKPEPVATKRLAILTLTRIFILTRGQQGLIREITTPLLSGFISACMNNVTTHGFPPAAPKVDTTALLLRTVIQAFIKLLPQHTSSFRPSVGKLRALLGATLAPTPSDTPGTAPGVAAPDNPSISITALAQRLFALLPLCAPKNASAAEWAQSLDTVLAHMHRTENHVFRAVREQGYVQASESARSVSFEDTLHDAVEDETRLPGWRGIHAGSERLVGLLQLIQAHVASTSSLEITIPLGSIFSALSRVLSVFEPVRARGLDAEMLHPEVSREERESLWSCLPAIHTAAVDTIWTITERVGIIAICFASDVLDQMIWVFERENGALDLRVAIYRTVEQIIYTMGASMEKPKLCTLAPVLRKACEDLLSPGQNQSNSSLQINGSTKAKTDNADSYLKLPGKDQTPIQQSRNRACPAAQRLVFAALSKLPPENLPKLLRRDLDRVAVLCQDYDTLLASVLSPPSGTVQAPAASLLPFLARSQPSAMGTEALLRPRIPLFRSYAATQGNDGLGETNGTHIGREMLQESIGHQPFTGQSQDNGDRVNLAGSGFDSASRVESVSKAPLTSSKRKWIGEDRTSPPEPPLDKRQRTTDEQGADNSWTPQNSASHIDAHEGDAVQAMQEVGPEKHVKGDIRENSASLDQAPKAQQLRRQECTARPDRPDDDELNVSQSAHSPAVAAYSSEARLGTTASADEEGYSSGSEIPPIILDSSSDEDIGDKVAEDNDIAP